MIKFSVKKYILNLPPKPGIYIFSNNKNIVLYVGKAKNLKKRVGSYFNCSKNLSPDKKLMLPQIAKIDYITTDSELEALLLESNLIKKHKPKYNIIFKDDKQYQYIKIDYLDDFPKIYAVRKIERDNASYFGPFTDGLAVKHTINLLNKLFPYRECNLEIYQDSKEELKRKVCLKYHIKRCLGPCVGKISKNEYNVLIRQCELFLRGKQEKIMKEIKNSMKKAAQEKNFEKAAFLRDQLFDLEKIIEKQKIISTKKIDQDIISLFQKNNIAIINLFIIREGKLIGKENFQLKAINKSSSEILSSFIKQHYTNQTIPPKEIILPTEIIDKHLITSFLSKKRVQKVKILIPKKSKKLNLIKLGEKNAKHYYNLQVKEKPKEKDKDRKITLEKLKILLKLKNIPTRIECYDISNIQGTLATGSMVVFEDNQPQKTAYRHFRIKFPSISDVDMMSEMLSRRFKNDNLSKWPQPDLIIIDGGRGQLNAALNILKDKNLNIPVISIAKKLEEIYSENFKKPIRISKNSQALQLIQRIRDEAHRFAITYHRKLKKKEISISELDNTKGIGKIKKKKLLQKFKTINNIKEAKPEELEKILGKKLTKKLKEQL